MLFLAWMVFVGFWIMAILSLAWPASDDRRKVAQSGDAIEDIDWALWDLNRTLQRIEKNFRITWTQGSLRQR
jgi:hypothetical protein